MKKPINILVVDDDKTFCLIINKILQMFKKRTFNPIIKESIESALLEIEKNNDIDIILVDYIFPTSNGLELCLQLNRMGRSVPIVLLTVVEDFKLAVEAMKLGVEDFILKKDIDKVNFPNRIISIYERSILRKHKQAVEKRMSMAENRAQAIRELIVTVCHEFNNPLAAIKISFDLLTRTAPKKITPEMISDFNNCFDKIDNEIKRLRDINFEKFDWEAQLRSRI